MRPEWVRELKQLWAVSQVYLERAASLSSETRTYGDFLKLCETDTVSDPDLKVLQASADLTSGAIRLASIDERLSGGGDALWGRVYLGGQPRLTDVHVLLRDATAHSEPVVGLNKPKYLKRQDELSKLQMCKALELVKQASRRLRRELEAACKSMSGFDAWLKSKAAGWVKVMK